MLFLCLLSWARKSSWIKDWPVECGHYVCVFVLCSACPISLLAQVNGTAFQQDSARGLRVQTAAKVVVKHYNRVRGLFDTAGWWNSANGITALADAAGLPGEAKHNLAFNTTFQRAQTRFPGFINQFYDDEGWWALAWIAVYDLDQQPQRLKMAETIFNDMTSGWDQVCGGGIWWKKDRHYKNAIANELFLSIAAKLALRTGGKDQQNYRRWAENEWKWFESSGMINDKLMVNDGLNPSCQNNGKYGSSYNQGVLLSGMVDLGELKQDAELRAQATRMAEASIKRLSGPDGIIKDGCEPDCGEDAAQFKGVYVRNLDYLYRAQPDAIIGASLKRNADSLWAQERDSTGNFSVSWSGTPGFRGAEGDISALDLFVAEQEATHLERERKTLPPPDGTK